MYYGLSGYHIDVLMGRSMVILNGYKETRMPKIDSDRLFQFFEAKELFFK